MLRLTHWSFCLPGESGEGWSCPIIPPAVGQRCLHIDSASANFYKIRERILEIQKRKKNSVPNLSMLRIITIFLIFLELNNKQTIQLQTTEMCVLSMDVMIPCKSNRIWVITSLDLICSHFTQKRVLARYTMASLYIATKKCKKAQTWWRLFAFCSHSKTETTGAYSAHCNLIVNVSRHWNSSLNVVEGCLELQAAVTAALMNNDVW